MKGFKKMETGIMIFKIREASGTGTLAIRLIHIQKVVTNGQDLQLQIYIVFGLP